MSPPQPPKRPAANDRDARLKAALKANIARRKQQARHRADTGAEGVAQDTEGPQSDRPENAAAPNTAPSTAPNTAPSTAPNTAPAPRRAAAPNPRS